MIKDYYIKYLREVRGNKDSTVNHYLDALNNISRRLRQIGLVQQNIYEIRDTESLLKCKDALLSDPDFIRLNSDGNQMYSAGLNNYIRFISGADFQSNYTIDVLDMPMVYCALKYEDDFEKAIVAAVNHKGDSDSTGAICGNILGARLGMKGIPDKYIENLELKDVIMGIADDLCNDCQISEYGSHNDPVWVRKYIEMSWPTVEKE